MHRSIMFSSCVYVCVNVTPTVFNCTYRACIYKPTQTLYVCVCVYYMSYIIYNGCSA